ncbi:MAG: murein biosynthesis integral membrane protein MurJ [Holosporales bacterium]|jgi:putative peptidoglycan lipid II flippase|nr:murein biosynthesis integral membrane protein MurJ [Holosporales bacterium]
MNIIKATATVSLFTMLSRITGFLRDMAIAAYVDKWLSDIFIISTKLGNMLRKVFAEGAFHASFVPRFSDILHKRGPQEAQRVASEAFSFLFSAVSLICVLVCVFYHYVLKLVAPGFQVGSFRYAIGMETGRICFWFIVSASLSALLSGVLNAYNKFALSSSIQCIFNLLLMSAVLLGPLCFPNVAYTMSIAVLAAGLIQVLILWFRVKQVAFSVRLTPRFFSSEVKDISRHMLPGMLSSGVWQINMLVDMRIASSLSVGTVTYIHFADRINQLPLSLIGVAMGTSLLVALSSSFNKNKLKLANAQFNTSVLLVTALSIPVLFIAFILAPELITVVFKRGCFNERDAMITAQVLMGFLTGLPAYVLSKVFSAAFFASKDTKTPVKIGILSVVVNIAALYTLTPIFAHIGIALATSISSWVNIILLYYILHRRAVVRIYASTWRKISLQLASVAITSIVVYALAIISRNQQFTGFQLMLMTFFNMSIGTLMFVFIGHKIGGFNARVFLRNVRK